MKTVINKYILLLAIVISWFISSCEDANDWGVDQSHSRMFRPATFTVDNVTATSAEVTFAKVNGTQFYNLEISHDSLLFENDVYAFDIKADTLDSKDDSYKIKFINLFGNTPHSVRIKVISLTNMPESQYATVYFRTKAEQILKDVNPTEKTSNLIKIKWESGSLVTHLMVIPDGGAAQQVDLTDQDKADAFKMLTGLSPETNYTIEIYNTPGNKRGTLPVKTYSAPPEAERIVWLTAADTLAIQAVMDSCTASSLTIVLPNGKFAFQNATVVSYVIKPELKTVNFWALPGNDTTKLRVKSFNLPSNVEMTAITFENLNVIGYDYANDYCFNPNGPLGYITKVSYKNCQIRNFRGVLRLRNAITVNNFIVTGCYVNRIKDYGLACADVNGDPLIDNISIENSTFSGMESFLLHRYRNSNSIILRNCTFYDMVNSGKYFVNCYGTAIFGQAVFEIENCIFSKMRYVDNAGVLTYGNCFRATKAPTITNCFKTSDFVNQSPEYDFLGLIDYGSPSGDLFTNPGLGNFIIKDASFAGKSTAGDPRWRP